jgi:hypothetical protein
MADPISRLQIVQQEIDRVFGAGYAAEKPHLVIAVMNAASSDYAAQLIAHSLRDIAQALLVDDESSHSISGSRASSASSVPAMPCPSRHSVSSRKAVRC